MATILMADDYPDIVRLLRMCLRKEGHNVITALDGAEAWELIQRERPDLVLLDVMMPGLDGFRVLNRIRTHPALRDTLVVMLTASVDPQDVTLGLDIGADCYLTKPFRCD